MALYGIKTGSDLSLKVCRQLSADATAKGLSSPSRPLVDDENQMSKIKAQTDKYLEKTEGPAECLC